MQQEEKENLEGAIARPAGKVNYWLLHGALAILGIGLGLFLGGLAIRGAQWKQVLEALSDLSPLLLAASGGILLLSAILRAVRWRLLWTNERVSTFRLFLVENAALGLNNLSPVRVVDEALEFGILTLRDRLPGGSVVATMMMCRILDLAFTLVFITGAVAILPPLLRFIPAIAFTGLFFSGWLLLLLFLGPIVRRFPWLRHVPAVVPFERAVNDLWSRPRRMALAFGVTSLYWLLLGPLAWLLAKGVGLSLPLPQMLVVVLGSIFFATAVPGLPGAVGTFEFGTVSLLDLWGVGQEPAITFAILLHAILFLPATVFAAVVLPREGIGSVKALRSLLRRSEQARQL